MKSSESPNNLKIWNSLKTPPKEALKTIQAGRLKGMSDISPQWRYEIMTQVFGACGDGWKFTIDKLWNEPASHDQVFCFASVSLQYKIDGNWSEPVQGVGGSMLVAMEKAGLHSSDEGYKMAITDALGTAMKMMGVAADVYAGKWDGSKYKDEPQPVKKREPKPEPPTIDEVALALIELAPQGFILNKTKVSEILEPMYKGDIPPMPLAKIVKGMQDKYAGEIYTEDKIPFEG